MSSMGKGIGLIEGELGVIVSAPHVFAHKRPTMTGKYKQGELWTDLIVDKVSQGSKCFGIKTLCELDYDPNYSKVETNPYKQELEELVKKGKIRALIDIHGLSDKNVFDIGIYYVLRFSKSKNLAYRLASTLDKGDLKGATIQILNLYDNAQETVTEYCAKKLHVPSIQVEVSRTIREDEFLRDVLISYINSFILTI